MILGLFDRGVLHWRAGYRHLLARTRQDMRHGWWPGWQARDRTQISSRSNLCSTPSFSHRGVVSVYFEIRHVLCVQTKLELIAVFVRINKSKSETLVFDLPCHKGSGCDLQDMHKWHLDTLLMRHLLQRMECHPGPRHTAASRLINLLLATPTPPLSRLASIR